MDCAELKFMLLLWFVVSQFYLGMSAAESINNYEIYMQLGWFTYKQLD
jgi:hypothetical protein